MRPSRQRHFNMKLLIGPFSVLLANCTSAPGPVVPVSTTERQMIGLLEKFDRWDFDGNGQLTASELLEAERISGHSPGKIIAFYDSNRNGSISLREAQAGYARADEAESRAQR
jgi:hypothetical protein